MDLHIRANGTKVTDGMQEFIDRKIAKLDRLASHVVDAQLELRTETSRTGAETTTAQLTLHTGHHILRSECRDAEPTKAIDSAIDKLLSQARKYSDKKAARRRRPIDEAAITLPPLPPADAITPSAPITATTAPAAVLDREYSASTDDGYEDEDEDDFDRVVRVKRFPMKPMQVEEAIDQLELVGHDFFFFMNESESQLNVLYRRRDGSYGLLLPS